MTNSRWTSAAKMTYDPESLTCLSRYNWPGVAEVNIRNSADPRLVRGPAPNSIAEYFNMAPERRLSESIYVVIRGQAANQVWPRPTADEVISRILHL